METPKPSFPASSMDMTVQKVQIEKVLQLYGQIEDWAHLTSSTLNLVFNSFESSMQELYGRHQLISIQYLATRRMLKGIANMHQFSIEEVTALHALTLDLFTTLEKTTTEVEQVLEKWNLVTESDTALDFIPTSRFLLVEWDNFENIGEGIIELNAAKVEKVSLDHLSKRQIKLINQAVECIGLPLRMYGHHYQRKSECWEIKSFILLPDYLVDVTSITSCIPKGKTLALHHLLKLYLYSPTSLPILIGTTVNDFLDELIVNPSLTFQELSLSLFQKNPLAFCLLDDDQTIEFFTKIQFHFTNLSALVNTRFNNNISHLSECLLEPSYYSAEYGVQGRLDVYYPSAQHEQRDIIVELKSGKPFRSNAYGINPEHQVQTMLYELLIQSVYKKQKTQQAMILYSAETTNPLRLSPPTAELNEELIYARNAIVLIHIMLAFPEKEKQYLTDRISPSYFAQADSFAFRDSKEWLKVYTQLEPIEKAYFNEFSAFVAREQWIARTGKSGVHFTEGLASLWLMERIEKEQHNAILPDLKILDIQYTAHDFPIITLSSHYKESYVHNFRGGDTIVLYHKLHNDKDILHQQVFKGTLVGMENEVYSIRLRTKQFPGYLRNVELEWNIEHDTLDRSFIQQFENLFLFAQANNLSRKFYLGTQQPEITSSIYNWDSVIVRAEIKEILQKALNSYPYFLIWGPPGTGKTSIVIQNLVKVLFEQTAENILLLAYTNRAVDEICEAIEKLGEDQKKSYIRIGSRFSVHENYQNRLLDEQAKKYPTRKLLIEHIKKTRIYCATIASLQGKKEIFLLKNFDTIIVDESSQILEPNLIGIISHCKRTILIGDHMQLPAVSAQDSHECQIMNEDLIKLGITRKNQSLFERLLQRCIHQGWRSSYGMLTHQGRMHEDVMLFPAKHFYKNQLRVLDNDLNGHQLRSYTSFFSKISDPFTYQLIKSRTLFIPIELETHGPQAKTNWPEAKGVALIVQKFQELFSENSLEWNDQRIGIITPFRAQIACIKKALQDRGLGYLPITVDTAERYQGGAREIVILSMVIQYPEQLQQVSSLNELGIDRKLNVALTRAKEQVIILGNEKALSTASTVYKNLINTYAKLEIASEECILEKDQ